MRAQQAPKLKYYSIGGFNSPPEGNNILKSEGDLYFYLGDGVWEYKDKPFLEDPVWIVKEINLETAKKRFAVLTGGKRWVP